jgi:hypothetical protein
MSATVALTVHYGLSLMPRSAAGGGWTARPASAKWSTVSVSSTASPASRTLPDAPLIHNI